MSFIRNHTRMLVVAASCAALGGGASVITSAGAATSPSSASNSGKAGGKSHKLLARAVHGELVVPTKTGFATVTFDKGLVQSVSGQQLTIKEGTKKATYKVITLSIPTNARVRDDRQNATLAALKPGQRVMVVQGPKRTLVVARTPRTA